MDEPQRNLEGTGSPKDPNTLEALDARLRARRARQEGGTERALHRPAGMPASAWGLAWRLAVEMVAAMVFGLGAGWLLDDWFGTAPTFVLILALLGIATGIWNVIRLTGRYQALQDAAEVPRSGARKERE
ncbi:AtpZ/AtpI family protein [Marinibaculum pumilum]|uniref:ATP synthase protein I n=1 Tax=Marinibaculum pumilum TaxID=1766165 RepID=A0ABV7KWH1_9PROT